MGKILIYCSKKTGNSAHCSELATYEVTLISKKGNSPQTKTHRCDLHKSTATVKRKIIDFKPLDQTKQKEIVFKELNSLIGKPVVSKFHRISKQYPFIGKYCKPNGGIMCLNEHTKKWKFVYHHQLIDNEISERQKEGNIDRSYNSPMQDWAETSEDL